MNFDERSPETVGMSSERLGRIQAKLKTYIDAGKVPGFVTLVARKGQVVHYEAYGYRDLENQLPIQKDTLFRIYSMTKAITSVALMMLYEEGKFHLYEPVSNYIPEFGKTKVLTRVGDQKPAYVSQKTPMTIKNVLTHTAGLTYDLGHDNPDEADARFAHFHDPNIPLDETIKRIASYPLICQPGSKWTYGVSTDVCGYLVQVISGMPFETYLQEKIFGPLGMVDTAFHVPAEKKDRLATLYAHNTETGALQLYKEQGFIARDFLVPTKSPFGGHGLVSTTEDYLRFVQMLLNGGELDGVRLLGRKTVEFMSMNHLRPELVQVTPDGWWMYGFGFGLGFAVVLDPPRTMMTNSIGTYEWGGAAATKFWIDPKEELVAVLMTQIMDNQIWFHDDFRVLTYQALID